MKIFIAADHAGFTKKNELIKKLEKHYDIYDMGPYALNPGDDYPIYASKVAIAVSQNQGAMGILLCKSGEGMAIAANKVAGIRAATVGNKLVARETRQDNNSNILSLSAEDLSSNEVYEVATTWLTTPFSELARHKRRINEIEKIEKGIEL